MISFIEYLSEDVEYKVSYSKILNNKDIIKDKKLTKKLSLLDHKGISGGFGAVLNYPNENPSKIVIAYISNEPIGWISSTNGVQNIFVKYKYRKSGIASKLKDILYNRK